MTVLVPQKTQPKSKIPFKLSPLVMVIVGGVAGVFLLFIPIFLILIMILATFSSPNVLPGVVISAKEIGRVNVGGLSSDQVTAKLSAISVNEPITLRDGARSWSISASALGISIDTHATLDSAMQAGRSDLFSAIQVMLSGTEVTPIYTLDMAKTSTALTSLTNTINTKPGSDPLGTHRVLNIGATLDRFPPTLSQLFASPTLDLVMDQQQGPHTTYTVQRGEELALIAKKFNVAMSDIIKLNAIKNADAIYPGQSLLIPAAGIWQPTEKDAPPAPLASGKSIVVSLGGQRIYAYQDGHLVHSTLMSSGLPGHETVLGDYHIYVKYPSTRMTGPGYDIPDVPWTMYFYQGYGIHGAYWHNAFGRQMSHGCVNLETSEAKWFYDFSPVGTLVRVIAA
jgi:LysM repeat protein